MVPIRLFADVRLMLHLPLLDGAAYHLQDVNTECTFQSSGIHTVRIDTLGGWEVSTLVEALRSLRISLRLT